MMLKSQPSPWWWCNVKLHINGGINLYINDEISSSCTFIMMHSKVEVPSSTLELNCIISNVRFHHHKRRSSLPSACVSEHNNHAGAGWGCTFMNAKAELSCMIITVKIEITSSKTWRSSSHHQHAIVDSGFIALLIFNLILWSSWWQVAVASTWAFQFSFYYER